MQYKVSEMLGWSGPWACSPLCSRLATYRYALRSRSVVFCSPAHRSAPAVFPLAPLQFPLRSRSSNMLCLRTSGARDKSPERPEGQTALSGNASSKKTNGSTKVMELRVNLCCACILFTLVTALRLSDFISCYVCRM